MDLVSNEPDMKKPSKLGVYGILCLANRKYYIGSGHADSRISSHWSKLRANQHRDLPRLQNDWNLYGESQFVAVRFPCPPDQIRLHETFLIENLKTLEHQQGYNKMLGGQWGIEARIRNTETKLVRYGHFKRLPGITAESPMTSIYIETIVL